MAHVRTQVVRGGVEELEAAINGEDCCGTHELQQVVRLSGFEWPHIWLVVWRERGKAHVEPAPVMSVAAPVSEPEPAPVESEEPAVSGWRSWLGI
jgi:hypothetical protein